MRFPLFLSSALIKIISPTYILISFVLYIILCLFRRDRNYSFSHIVHAASLHLLIWIWRLFHCVKSVRIRSFSGPNAGKYGPENLRIRTLFTQWLSLEHLHLAGFLKSLQVSHATKSLVLKLVFECCFQYTSVINYSAQFLCLAKFLLVVWLGFLFLLLLIDITSIIRPFSRIFNHTTVLCLCWISSSSAP